MTGEGIIVRNRIKCGVKVYRSNVEKARAVKYPAVLCLPFLECRACSCSVNQKIELLLFLPS
jgi:hypothetical protein